MLEIKHLSYQVEGDGGEELGILLRDHVIIGDNCYFSFLEKDILKEV